MGSLVGHLLPGFYFFMLASWGFSNEARALAQTTSRHVIFNIALQRLGRYTLPLIEILQAEIGMQCPSLMMCRARGRPLFWFGNNSNISNSIVSHYIAVSMSRCRGPPVGYRSQATHQGSRRWPLESGLKLAAFLIQVRERRRRIWQVLSTVDWK